MHRGKEGAVNQSPSFIHSVTLDAEKCRGCTNCIKRCPTEAIRVRGGKAQITESLCIDCGECIRICPYKAKKPIFDKFEDISRFKYKIALPAPALFGQFDNMDDVDYVLDGLLRIGFDDVFEVSRAAEIVTEFTRKYMEKRDASDPPVISSACPVIVRLIATRFPYLCDSLLPLLAPVELAARMARREALENHPELTSEEIGIFFISPCPAKVSYVKNPIGVEKSEIDGALSISELYFKLVPAMKPITRPRLLSRSGVIGISWATTGGEAAGLLNGKYLAADGIENVIKVLDEIENENISDLDFIELNACAGGCVGGMLTVENPYIAKARLQELRKYLPLSQNHMALAQESAQTLKWQQGISYRPVNLLDSDMTTAISKRAAIDDLVNTLPGLDCGSCGAPSCKALAEDIIQGKAYESDCIFKMKEKIQEIFRKMADIEHYHLDTGTDDSKSGQN